jgi:Fe-S-cluster containining protein
MGIDYKNMSDARRLRLARGLYQTVKPGFPCKQGCFECCKTVVQLLRVEWEHLSKLPVLDGKNVYIEIDEEAPELVRIVDDRGWCPFLDDATGKCRVYVDRPLTCRVYAQHWGLACEQGVKCPDELHVTHDTFVKMRRLAGFNDEEEFPLRTEEESRAIGKAVEEWRARVGTIVGLPGVSEHRKILARAIEIVGHEFR